MPNLKIYTDEKGNEIGYDSKELSAWMKERQFLKAWQRFAMGSTGMIIDGHFIVYKWDVESFLEGRENLD